RDRQSAKDSRHHDMGKMVNDLSALAATSPAMALMCDEFLSKLQGEHGEELSERYFSLLLTSLLEGLVHVVLPLQQRSTAN
ncbi:MAG: hypothetical protein ACRCWS_06350, partial [Propionibacteriaceae bacterium]